MRAQGLPEPVRESMRRVAGRSVRALQRQSEIPILSENLPALDLFLACQTQWRVAGMAGMPMGLDYVAVDIVRRELGLKASDVMWRVRAIEAGALEQWQRQRETAN